MSASRGTYTYSDGYQADTETFLTVRIQHQDGSLTYKDLGSVPASSSFISGAVDVWVPMTASDVTVFHLLKGIGTLTLDNVALKLKALPSGIFTTGGGVAGV